MPFKVAFIGTRPKYVLITCPALDFQEPSWRQDTLLEPVNTDSAYPSGLSSHFLLKPCGASGPRGFFKQELGYKYYGGGGRGDWPLNLEDQGQSFSGLSALTNLARLRPRHKYPFSFEHAAVFADRAAIHTSAMKTTP